jgi:hypothetical protein
MPSPCLVPVLTAKDRSMFLNEFGNGSRASIIRVFGQAMRSKVEAIGASSIACSLG